MKNTLEEEMRGGGLLASTSLDQLTYNSGYNDTRQEVPPQTAGKIIYATNIGYKNQSGRRILWIIRDYESFG
jgi:hypothetical protein